ncbi:hypothetical protein EDB87DRAFT_1577895 [Lactarius vividus]|nr:hypothetical protein EDB87DRAFT_1577895 [Lactarius vividus]
MAVARPSSLGLSKREYGIPEEEQPISSFSEKRTIDMKTVRSRQSQLTGHLISSGWEKKPNLIRRFKGAKWLHLTGDSDDSDPTGDLQLSDERPETVFPARTYIREPELRYAPLREAVVPFMDSCRLSGSFIGVEFERSFSYQATIEVLSGDILLDIFLHFLEGSSQSWPTLIHVSQSWRQIILASPLGLDLRLHDHRPLAMFSLVMSYGRFPILGLPAPYDEANIVAALKRSDRDIVDLRLRDIPRVGYFSPEAFANALFGMIQLRQSSHHFLSLSPRRDHISLPPPSGERAPVVLPALTNFKYWGTRTPTRAELRIPCEQLDCPMAQICGIFSAFLLRVEDLDIETTKTSPGQDGHGRGTMAGVYPPIRRRKILSWVANMRQPSCVLCVKPTESTQLLFSLPSVIFVCQGSGRLIGVHGKLHRYSLPRDGPPSAKSQALSWHNSNNHVPPVEGVAGPGSRTVGEEGGHDGVIRLWGISQATELQGGLGHSRGTSLECPSQLRIRRYWIVTAVRQSTEEGGCDAGNRKPYDIARIELLVLIDSPRACRKE